MEIALLVGRILFGGLFLMNGISHFTQRSGMVSYAKSRHLPMPGFLVMASGVLLLLSGLGIIFGVYVRESLAIIAGLLVLIAFSLHTFWNDSGNDRMAEMGAFTKNMALLGATLMMYSINLPWAFSL